MEEVFSPRKKMRFQLQQITNPHKNNPNQKNEKLEKKKRKKEKKKRKRKNDKKKFTIRDCQQWQITFVTLNNNEFCLLSIYPLPIPHPPTSASHTHPCCLDNVKLD